MKFRIYSHKYKLYTDDPFWPSNQHTYTVFALMPDGEIWELVTVGGEEYFRDVNNHKLGELEIHFE